jgi:branched-subunit amino acid aminotransferase/4-amino-4-deoxychorismate lyase
MLNNQDAVACGGRSNLFAVIDGTLRTPGIDDGALPGITRHAVLALCKADDTPILEGPIARLELLAATEMFVTNSLVEVMPVRRFDGGDLPVGPVTKRLAEAYAGLTP